MTIGKEKSLKQIMQAFYDAASRYPVLSPTLPDTAGIRR